MNQDIIPIESIRERDIDLLLLEELSTDNYFCEWLINQLSLPKFTSNIGAWRSISDFGLGESDIIFSYFSNESKIIILIENKLDANFQDEQFNRYFQRAKEYVNRGDCEQCFCVLVAPKLYCENQTDFENFVSYEEISDRLKFASTQRSIFKSHLLQIGVEKLRRGYKPINSIIVQDFWKKYWDFKEAYFPQFNMKKPDIVPHNSDWPMLYEKSLPKIIFYHKFAHGTVDATFKGYNEEFEFKIKEILPDWINFIKHSKSFSLRIFSTQVNRAGNFDAQVESVNEGLKNLEKLRVWLIENRKQIL